MKNVFVVMVMSLVSNFAVANDPCLQVAKLEARTYYADVEELSLSDVRVKSIKVETSDREDVVSYTVQINGQKPYHFISVDLKKYSCRPIETLPLTDATIRE